uniref:CAZy families CBM50 protein n=1 Tax=uncultured Thermoanaerobacter sp. TaxID=242695 RepID=A0A060C7F8_9THEO|nr:CAZy families CBM50 protein [uncultured Thermoanaerobacter sp.]
MQVYKLAKGDTLWMVAKKFGITLEEIIKANPQIKDPNKIFPGEEVNIPLPVTDGKSVYTAQSGDTMWSIARKFDISP